MKKHLVHLQAARRFDDSGQVTLSRTPAQARRDRKRATHAMRIIAKALTISSGAVASEDLKYLTRIAIATNLLATAAALQGEPGAERLIKAADRINKED